MRILYLSQLVPYPPDAGPKVRIYHVLQYLAAAGHEVTLVAFSRPDDDPAALEHLRDFCTAVHTVPMIRSRRRDISHLLAALFDSTPFLIRRDSVAEMWQLLRQLVQQHTYDAIHADQLWMAAYARYAGRHAPNQPLLVLDQHNAMFLIPRRLAENGHNAVLRRFLYREARQMAHYEVETCSAFDRVVWVTDEDRAAVQQAARQQPGWARFISGPTIPICVDLANRPALPISATASRVTFLGGLHWPPNAAGISWFADEVWPRVYAEAPQATLTIIGKNPPAGLAERPGVAVTGYVPDPEPYLRETAAFIVPLHAGGGMRVKIIDAWSWGLPVVSTTIGAEGICYRAGEELLRADDPAAFAAAVLRLLREPALREQLGAAGRARVASNYDWRHVYPAWDHVYRPVK